MAVTILALVFLGIILLVAYFGFRILGKRTSAPSGQTMERCSICRGEFPKEMLVVRQVGDYKLVSFCRSCILSLYADLGMRN